MVVVLLIIGISLSLVTPNFMKNDEDVLKEESVRLIALMDYATDAASSQGHWLAWRPTASGYRFLQLDENKNIWQPIATDEVLRERKLPDGMSIAAANNKQVAVSINSMVILSPSGIQSPYQIELALAKVRRVIRGNLLGKAEILNPDLAVVPIL
jgi:general secretion pathway protein H